VEDTEITLNGTDWSNLYIIDYAGGCGGEQMCDYLSEKINAQFTIVKSPDQEFAIDSFANMYVTGRLEIVYDDIELYNGYKDIEINSHIHSDDTMKHNLKMNLIHRIDDLSQHIEDSSQDEIDSLVRDIHFTENYILRSHSNTIDWSSFTNANVIRIYSLPRTSHLTYSLMMLKRWVVKNPYDEEFIESVPDSIREWVALNIVSTKMLYNWQLELIMYDQVQDFNWSSFVEDRFTNAEIDETSKSTISGTEWVFGLGEKKNVVGIDISTEEIKTWQQDNIDLLAEHGISMTSTREHCIAYFKDYWNINNIPCVTEV